MITKKNILVVLFVLLVAAGSAMVFFMFFEKAEMTQTTPQSAEARKNPYLAAERFLAQQGFAVESVAKREILINPPPPDDLIFVSRLGGNLPTERESNLIGWIESGGTLVITHTYPWDEVIEKSSNTLLDRLGVRRHSARELEEIRKSQEEDQEDGDDDDYDEYDDDYDGESGAYEDGPAAVYNEQAGEPAKKEDDTPVFDSFDSLFKKETVTLTDEDKTGFTIEFIADQVLEDGDNNAVAAYAGETGNHIIVKDIGLGKLVVLSDSNFLKNNRIGENDHAYYLATLARGHAKIWLLYNSIMPSFMSLVVEKAPEFLACLALLSLMSVLWLTIRIGPRYSLRDHSRRNIIEHLLAAGFFIMKHGSTHDLLHVSRSAIDKRIMAKHLFFHRKSKDEQVDYIAKWTQLPKKEVHAAFNDHSQNRDGFVAMTAVLQKITQDILNAHTTEKK